MPSPRESVHSRGFPGTAVPGISNAALLLDTLNVLDALAPARTVLTLKVDGDAAVDVTRLLTRPCNRFFHSGTDFNLRRQLHPSAVTCRQEKGRLANAPP